MADAENAQNPEERIDELERTVEFLKETIFDLEDIVYGEYDGATAAAEAERRGGVFDRLDALERDELTISELLEAKDNATLPIQQLTAARKAGHLVEERDKNRYRCTFVWSEFYDRAIKEPTVLKLSSQQVQNILRENDLPTNRNTVRRVMEFVAKFSNPDATVDDPQAEGNLLRLRKANGKNTLVAKREAFEELANFQAKDVEDVQEEADMEFAQLEAATMTPDGGEIDP